MGMLDQPFQPESSGFCCSNGELQISQSSHHDATRDPKERHENDVMLSEAMNKLTFEEREEQEEVLHGVDPDVAEEANFIESALDELGRRLEQQKGGTVYEAAERTSLDYVRGRAFRLMFLRGNRYDSKAAADQMIRFFKIKQEIFGAEKLVKDITIEDLNQDDLAYLRTGWTQLCGRDSSGRIVIIQLPGARPTEFKMRSEMRSRYFLLMEALKSEKTQLRGCIWICYTTDAYKDKMNGKGYPEIVDVSLACPIYPGGIHFCGDDHAQYFMCTLALKIFPTKLRARVRLHFGSHQECQYRLSTYGIPSVQLPLMPDTYEINRQRYLKWFHSCFGDFKAEVSQSAVRIRPCANDVLYMFGNRTNNTGNHHLRNLIAEWSVTYDAATNEEKRRVVDEIINAIHSSGGRFLDQASHQDDWVVLPIERVRVKISQGFRNHRRKVNGSRRKRNPSTRFE